MLKLEIVTVGKVKSGWIKKGVEHYQKLLSKYATVSFQIVKEADSATLAPEQVKIKETMRIIKVLDDSSLHILLEERGKEFKSTEFAEYLENTKNQYSKIQFIIGGAFGLHHSLRKHGKLNLSLSTFTFPHEMSLLILLEQLYRVMSISAGSKYHKK